MTRYIAGHCFEDKGQGLICSCGRRWVDISSATTEDINKPHIAHSGLLTPDEAAQIEAERNRVWSALSEVCG